jgi:hypothetical protein
MTVKSADAAASLAGPPGERGASIVSGNPRLSNRSLADNSRRHAFNRPDLTQQLHAASSRGAGSTAAEFAGQSSR